jgi:hypothetical protein
VKSGYFTDPLYNNLKHQPNTDEVNFPSVTENLIWVTTNSVNSEGVVTTNKLYNQVHYDRSYFTAFSEETLPFSPGTADFSIPVYYSSSYTNGKAGSWKKLQDVVQHVEMLNSDGDMMLYKGDGEKVYCDYEEPGYTPQQIHVFFESGW